MKRSRCGVNLLVFMVSLFACVFLQSLFAEDTAMYELAVLHTNDTHGHPVAVSSGGGMPALATLAAEVRQAYKNVLMLDAGDFNTGMSVSNMFKAEPDIVGYNFIGYDAMTVGNHEFDNTRDILLKQIEGARFPFISANILTKEGANFVKPYIVKHFDGFKVGIFELTTTETPNISGNAGDLVFADEVETAKWAVSQLRTKENVDVVIALVHLGIDEVKAGFVTSKTLAEKVPGIDLIVDGHSHTYMEKPLIVNKVPIVQAYQWGQYMGKAVLRIQGGKVVDTVWECVPINQKTAVKKEDGTTETRFVGKELIENAELKTILKWYVDKEEAALSEVVGTAADTFVFGDRLTRKQETALGNLVTDGMMWYAQNSGTPVDFAITNGGGIRAELPKGQITKKSVITVLPFDNFMMILTLKGSDVIELFNYVGSIAQGNGAFAQVSHGVSYTINYNTGACEDLLINGKPVDPNKTYRIATNDFIAAGKDGYVVFTKAIDRYDTSAFLRDVIIEYVKQFRGPLVPQVEGRINIIPKKTSSFPLFMVSGNNREAA